LTADVVTLTVTPRLRRQYAVRFAAHSQALAGYRTMYGVRYVRVPTAMPPVDFVVGALRREALVGR
jgi:hypothetical protein